MKILVVLCFVVVLALIGGAAAGDLKKVKDEETCSSRCVQEKQLPDTTCKEACSVRVRAVTSWDEAAKCPSKCGPQLDGAVATPEAKKCEAGCNKEYRARMTELTAKCVSVCSKTEKEPVGIKKCTEVCSPAVIEQMMQDA